MNGYKRIFIVARGPQIWAELYVIHSIYNPFGPKEKESEGLVGEEEE